MLIYKINKKSLNFFDSVKKCSNTRNHSHLYIAQYITDKNCQKSYST